MQKYIWKQCYNYDTKKSFCLDEPVASHYS